MFNQPALTPLEDRPIRLSASLLILRDGPEGIEVMTVKRSDKMRYLPGFLAFPGGAISHQDDEWSQDGLLYGEVMNGDVSDEMYVLGAIRECAEEIGWVCGIEPGGIQGMRADRDITEEIQLAFLNHPESFKQWVQSENLYINLSYFRFIGRWVGPHGRPAQFDTRFYALTAIAQDLQARTVALENQWARWCRPQTILEDIKKGKEKAVPPTIAMFEGIACFPNVKDCMDHLCVQDPTIRKRDMDV